jgi:hypothetical protein
MAKQIIQKPRFEEVVGITTMNLPDENLKFNSQKIGPMNFNDLRNADYGEGFRMPTIGEAIPLIYTSLENKDYTTAKKVIKTLKQNWITGNTGILYTPEGMFVQDNPSIKNGKIVMNANQLEKKLGSFEEKGVVFSDDKSIRFTNYDFQIEFQSSLQLAKNKGVIAYAGGEEKAEQLAEASEYFKIKPYFFALKNVNSPQTRVADLGSDYFGSGLGVDANDSEGFGGRFSFGVSEMNKGK